MRAMNEASRLNRVKAADVGLPSYLDMNAEIGFTKHLGGQPATIQLAEMCHIRAGDLVLNVGCGSGHAAIFLSNEYDCDVEGVDVITRMVEMAKENVDRFGGSDRVRIQEADAQELPFDANAFDAVICESVNTFVPDKPRAFREYFRVLKPGGKLGFNEGLWIAEPTPKGRKVVQDMVGRPMLPPVEWVKYMREAGFTDLVSDVHPIQVGAEARGQLGLVGIREYLQVLSRFFKLFLGDPRTRGLYKQAMADPRDYFSSMGYGLFAGRKPYR
jgi:ubiquinone/menaquinone biosynthesis C-methylase UbiE